MNIPETCDFPDCDCDGPERCEKGKITICQDCEQYPADEPSSICAGCEAYREHQFT